MRLALNTREVETVRRTIRAMQKLVLVPADPATGTTIGMRHVNGVRTHAPCTVLRTE